MASETGVERTDGSWGYDMVPSMQSTDYSDG